MIGHPIRVGPASSPDGSSELHVAMLKRLAGKTRKTNSIRHVLTETGAYFALAF
jgi:hypothetical protein